MRNLATTLLLLLTALIAGAQGLNTPERGLWPETPQAATLREVAMPPPDLSTGAVSLSIPLYTIQADDLSIPLELRYRSNGVRVTDDPYPVGYGWSLTPAMKITRCIMGRPDGHGYEFIGNRTPSSLKHKERQRCMVRHNAPGNDPRLDPERDLFTVHLPDATFNAYLDGDTFTAPGHSEYLITGSPKLGSITVTDPLGRIWTFRAQGALWLSEFPLEWCAESVLLPSGRTVSVKWQAGRHGGDMQAAWYTYDVAYPLSPGSFVPHESFSGLHNVSGSPPDQCMNPLSVTFPGGTVTFSYNGGSVSPSTLGEITVKAGEGTVEHITLAYGSGSSESTMLGSVTFRDGSSYSFTYDPERFSAGAGCDYWGFYNRSGPVTAPEMTIGAFAGMRLPARISGADRSPDPAFMKARLLKSVTYPTGGSCEWECEPHRFSPEDFAETSAISGVKDRTLSSGGGLRVCRQTLRESASDTSPTVVEYIYGTGGDGLAVAEALPTASTFLTLSVSVGSDNAGTESGFSPGRADYGVISGSPVSNCHSYRMGDPVIWYRQVEERHAEGRVVHTFTKEEPSDFGFTSMRGYTPVSLMSLFSCGVTEVLTETYGLRNGKETLLKKTEREYDAVDAGKAYGGLLIHRSRTQAYQAEIAPDFPEEKEIFLPAGIYAYSDDEIYEVQPYTVHPIAHNLSTETTTVYTSAGETVTTREWDYVEGTSLCRSETVSDRVSTEVTEYSYDDRFSTSVAAAMRKANVVGTVTGVRRTRGDAVSEEMLEMRQIGSGALFRPVTLRKSRAGAVPYTAMTYAWNSDGTLASSATPDGVRTAYTWDEQRLHPISSTVAGKLTSKATWKPLVGVASLTDPAGVKETYTYDAGNRPATVSRGGRLLETHTYTVSRNGTSSVSSKSHTSATAGTTLTSRVDGLGRVWATETLLPSGTVSVLTEHDAMGRPFRSWKGAPVQAGALRAAIRSSAVTFHDDASPYEETEYEQSPLARAIAVMPGGDAWKEAGKRTVSDILANGVPTNSMYAMKATADGVEISGLLPAGTVTIERTTDPDGNVHTAYRDSRGLTVYENRGRYGTYYVYDDYGDLRYILPPGCPPQGKRTAEAMQRLAYWYDYDSRGRLVTRKLPGAREERLRYDPADRLVAEQGIDLPDGVWRLYAYDSCGRQAVTFDMQLTDAQVTAYASVCRTATLTSGGKYSGYSISSAAGMPAGDITVVRALYYDTHDFVTQLGLGDGFLFRDPFSELGLTPRVDVSHRSGALTGSSAGKLTGMYTGSGWESYHYNPMGLEVQRHATGFNRGWTTTFYTYDLKPASVHRSYGGGLPDMDSYMTYDAASRPVSVRHVQRRRVNGLEVCDTATILTAYDRIGRVEAQTLGRATRKFIYDLHGWLRETTATAPNGLTVYTEKMLYEDGAKPLYSGKVSGHQWRHGMGGWLDRYDFTYDTSGFLTEAAYSDITDFYEYSTEYSYGMRGELTGLRRHGLVDAPPGGGRVYGVLDDVTASYEGNRLTRLSVESDAGVFATRVGMRAEGDFTLAYDHAGRLAADGSRGISRIDYDNNGYTACITFDTGEEYTQSHDSEGRLTGSVTRMLTQAGKTLTKTVTYTGGGHVLRNDTLEMTRFDGGYFDADGKARYYLTDFRGNNTCVIDGAGNRVHATVFYPYGEPHIEDAWTTGTAGGLKGNRFLFAGNERVTDLGAGMYDFNARQYVASFPRFTRMDPLCERYPWLSPYSYCGGDPINLSDPSGEVIETVWDAGNVAYDLGAAVYAHLTGNHREAVGYWIDFGMDAFAMAIPGLPAGASKVAKAGKAAAGSSKATKSEKVARMAKGTADEARKFKKAQEGGRAAGAQATLVPLNGKGNKAGNRTRIDWMEQREAGNMITHEEYLGNVIVENKLTNRAHLSKGQRAARDHVLSSPDGAMFESRSKIEALSIKPGDKIKIIDYDVRYGNFYKK